MTHDTLAQRSWQLRKAGHKKDRRRARREQFQRLRLEALEDRTLLSAVSWIGPNGGDWDTKANWSTGLVPTSLDDVTINSAGSTINHAASNADAVNSLTIESQNITLLAGSLTIGGGGMTISNGLVDVRAGATLDISNGATVLAEEGSSTGQFGITVEALGTMNVTGASFTHTGNNGRSQLQVNAGGTFTATGSSFEWSGLTLANTLSATDVTGNTFNQPITIAVINADKLTDNTGFQYVYLLPGTLTSTQTATLAPLAAGQVYVLTLGLTVSAGATLNVNGANVIGQDGFGTSPGITVDGVMNVNGASFTNAVGSGVSALQINADGTLNATGSTFSWSSMTIADTLTSTTQVRGNTFAGTTTLAIAVLDADKIGNNAGLQQVYMLPGTLTSGQTANLAPLAAGQVYVFYLGLTVSAGATLNVNGADVVGLDGFGTSPGITVDGVMNLNGASFTNAAGSGMSAVQINADGTLNATGSNYAWSNLTLRETLSPTNVTGNTFGPNTIVSITAIDADKLTDNSGFQQVYILPVAITNGQTATLVPLGTGQIYVFTLGLEVSAGATLNVNGAKAVGQDGFGTSPSISVDGVMNVNGASFTNAAGSGASLVQINADGTLNVSGSTSLLWADLSNAGNMTVPAAPVPMGNFTQTSTGVLNLRIAGSSASGQYSQLSVNTAKYAGAVVAQVVNGFVPNNGDTFTVVKAVIQSGTFSSLTPTTWTASYPSNTVVLTAQVYPLTDTTPPGTTLTATEAINASRLVVATFSEATPNGQVSDFRPPIINWGGGMTSTGTISLLGHTTTETDFEVLGGNTYPEEGGFPVQVFVTALDGASLTSNGKVTVIVGDAQLSDATSPTTINATEGTDTGPQVVALFNDANPNAPVSDFTNTVINWGDQNTSTGMVQLVGRTNSMATFQVVGNHTYAGSGTYQVTETIHDIGGSVVTTHGTNVVVQTATLSDTTPAATLTATEGGNTGSQVVATFSDAYVSAPLSDFSSVSIDWGDQQTSAGNVQLVSRTTTANFEILGSNTYAEDGSYTVTVTMHLPGGGNFTTNKTNFRVADAALSNTTPPTTIHATEGSSTGTQVVASFSDANLNAPLSDFANTVINWGDQLTSTGMVQLIARTSTASLFQVVGSHTYAEEGNDTVFVTIPIAGRNAFSTSKIAFVVGDAQLTDSTTPTTFNASAGASTGNELLATFTDANPNASVSDFGNAAVINWEDGTTSTVAIQPVGSTSTTATFQVVGSHTYTRQGAYLVAVTISDKGGSRLTANETRIFVALSSWHAADVSLGSDGQSRVLWSQSSGAASTWSVSSTFQVNTGTLYSVGGGWKAQAVAAGADGLTRVLWTNSNGATAVWVESASGTLQTSRVFSPLAGWTARDITVASDGQARMLWTNTNGQAALWRLDSFLNVASAAVYGPFSGWTVQRFKAAADGTLWLLWNSVDGQAALWQLNLAGSLTSSNVFAVSGWQAQDLAIDNSNQAHLLWTNAAGAVAIWTVTEAYAVTAAFVYGPIAGWSAQSLAAGANGQVWLLWDSAQAAAALWLLDSSGNVSGAAVYGPF